MKKNDIKGKGQQHQQIATLCGMVSNHGTESGVCSTLSFQLDPGAPFSLVCRDRPQLAVERVYPSDGSDGDVDWCSGLIRF